MAAFTTFANDLADQQLPNGGSGTVTIGGSTYTLPFKAQPTSTMCSDSTPGTALGSPGSIAGSFGTAAASRQKSSTAAVSMPGAPAGNWADLYIVDSSATPKPVVYKGGTSFGKTINAGDTLVIPAGQLTATINP